MDAALTGAAGAPRGRRGGTRVAASGWEPTRRLVVHVGTCKTGSTTIQDALARLTPALAGRGIHVPSTGRFEAASARHGNLLASLTGFRYDAARGGWRELAEEIRSSDARAFVISDEGLVRVQHAAAAVAAVAGLAADCCLAVDVVGYVRPQCQYLESSYAQYVKSGSEEAAFDAYLADAFAMRRVARHPQLDYRRVFAPWRAAFGDRVAVTPFERSRLTDGLLGHFLGRLGACDLAGSAAGGATNARIGAKALEVRRLTTVALRRRGSGRARIVRVVPALHGLSALLHPDAPFAGLSSARAHALTEGFAAANAAFARDYGISADGVLFRDPTVGDAARPSMATWWDLSATERAEVREYVMGTAGVDPAPVSRCGRRRVRRATRVEGIRASGLLGALPWRAAWLLDAGLRRRGRRRMVRRARQRAGALRKAVACYVRGRGTGP